MPGAGARAGTWNLSYNSTALAESSLSKIFGEFNYKKVKRKPLPFLSGYKSIKKTWFKSIRVIVFPKNDSSYFNSWNHSDLNRVSDCWVYSIWVSGVSSIWVNQSSFHISGCLPQVMISYWINVHALHFRLKSP